MPVLLKQNPDTGHRSCPKTHMGGVGRQEKLDFVISGAMLGWALDKQQQFFFSISLLKKDSIQVYYHISYGSLAKLHE